MILTLYSYILGSLLLQKSLFDAGDMARVVMRPCRHAEYKCIHNYMGTGCSIDNWFTCAILIDFIATCS